MGTVGLVGKLVAGRCLIAARWPAVCRDANRVSFEVLAQAAPRLTRGLPEREEGLDDEAYWAR